MANIAKHPDVVARNKAIYAGCPVPDMRRGGGLAMQDARWRPAAGAAPATALGSLRPKGRQR